MYVLAPSHAPLCQWVKIKSRIVAHGRNWIETEVDTTRAADVTAAAWLNLGVAADSRRRFRTLLVSIHSADKRHECSSSPHEQGRRTRLLVLRTSVVRFEYPAVVLFRLGKVGYLMDLSTEWTQRLSQRLPSCLTSKWLVHRKPAL